MALFLVMQINFIIELIDLKIDSCKKFN